jgi:HD-GYP domain-containing protein (c-di-GMP phosphodiesterase class II)
MISKNILIFNENDKERLFLSALLDSEEFAVFETSRVLEALHILRSHDIGIVLASHRLSGTERQEFRAVVEAASPGVTVLFLGDHSEQSGTIPFGSDAFKQFLQDSLKKEVQLDRTLIEFHEFIFSFTDRLLQIFDVNNRYFFNNDHIISRLATMIAHEMKLDQETVSAIRMASLLKDIGKVGIHNKLFDEKKKLETTDLLPLKTHPLNAVHILRDIKFPWAVDAIISQHHENYDGSGYPKGLKGRQIAIGARIIHIADSYVAMTTDRPYRAALSADEAAAELMKRAGTHFDPEIVEIFLGILKDKPSLMETKKNILILEREANLTALIRLSVNPNETDVLHAATSFDAIRLVRARAPELIVADVDMMDTNTFTSFYRTLQGVPTVSDKPFIFILPDTNYPRHFSGEKLHYITKPVDMSELFTTIRIVLKLEGAPVQQKHELAKGLSGTLEDFGLTDIIQILNLGLKTARVELRRDGIDGTIYLNRGRVRFARCGKLEGKESFFEMTRWRHGTFQIFHGEKGESSNISMDTIHLLLEAARIQDEQARVNPSMN